MLITFCICSTALTNIHSNHIPNWLELLIFYLFFTLNMKWIVLPLLSDILLVLELMSILLLLWLQELYMDLNMEELIRQLLECFSKSKLKKIFLNLSIRSKIKTEFFLVLGIESTKTMILEPKSLKTYIIIYLGCFLSFLNLWKITFDWNSFRTIEDRPIRWVLHK